MTKQVMKRIASPRTWNIARKTTRFITRPNPGAHSYDQGIALAVVLKEHLGICQNLKEVKYVISQKQVLVDQVIRDDHRHNIGLMDVLALPLIGKVYRLVLDKKGKLAIIEIPEKEAGKKVCKVTGKSVLKKGMLQLNLSDGRNIMVQKNDVKVGSSVVIDIPSQKMAQNLPLEKGSLILLTGGKHMGDMGTIEEIKEGILVYKNAENKKFQTARGHAFVIGKDKAVIKVQ
ncbi:30S ribosomal protein S4e [Candidatus Woesearchaeota archaeon]|nr:MAG: 30S ribosomal protein S4e, small subunit ribosomal protein S4e [archaeon GW2011_AR4]MBS3129180.1 30S ribosomal protein S4e [Candidatus Woesearchaeota archaeon]HIH37913.1 30S ribosomal protein S4e [Candidatus Woesearchaeota archaeon]HIH48878.1 30S ribosomal protein S4e [Candidatus Woesearchaeota archaeon]HIJ04040.1 30S ribosomal protein S4e [Candidatus Woesearchaeota archaeon]